MEGKEVRCQTLLHHKWAALLWSRNQNDGPEFVLKVSTHFKTIFEYFDLSLESQNAVSAINCYTF